MLALSSTDVAIRCAKESGTLRVTEETDRFGETFWAIADDVGLIEVASSEREAMERVG